MHQVRLRAVLAVARGEHMPAVAKALSVGERAVRNWVHRYNVSGLSELQDGQTGRCCRLSEEDQTRLKERIRSGLRKDDGVCSLRGEDIRRILRNEFHTEYAEPSVYYLLHQTLGLSYLKPRPIHRKTNPAAIDESPDAKIAGRTPPPGIRRSFIDADAGRLYATNRP